MANLKLSAVFSLIDKFSAPMRAASKVVQGASTVINSLGLVSGKTASRLDAASSLIEEFGNASQKAEKKSDGFLKKVIAIGGAAIALKGLKDKAFQLFGDMIKVNSEFEDFESVLETTLGTSDKAKNAMRWIREFAQNTPYELDEVTASYVALTSYGIDPQTRAMKTLGDTAKAMKKDYGQAIEALADAKTGEFERLKEFGIRADSKGKKVTFTYVKMGKEISIVSEKTGAAIEKNLLDIFDERFAGAMAKASKNWNGLISNMKDSWSGFLFKIGDAGVFDYLKNKLSNVFGAINAPKAQAKTSIAAKKISDTLIKMFEAIDKVSKKINIPKAIENFTKFITTIDKIITKLGGFEGVINLGIAAWIAGIVFNILTLGGTLPILLLFANLLFGLQIAAAPVLGIIALIAALAAGGFLLWRNWSKVEKWWSELWAGIFARTSAVIENIISKFNSLKPAFESVMASLWSVMPSWFRGLVEGTMKLALPVVKNQNQSPLALAAIGQNNQTMNAHLVVDVNGGRVSDLKSSDKNFKVTAKEKLGLQGVYP